MDNFVKISIWLLCLLFAVDWSFELISMDSTIANIVGFGVAIATIYFSVKTKCFTNIKVKRNEKNN